MQSFFSVQSSFWFLVKSERLKPAPVIPVGRITQDGDFPAEDSQGWFADTKSQDNRQEKTGRDLC